MRATGHEGCSATTPAICTTRDYVNFGCCREPYASDMAQRTVRLRGDVFDLQTLEEYFGEGDPRVWNHGGEYHLSASLLDDLAGSEMATNARRLLALLDGAARLYQSSHRPVGLGQVAASPAAMPVVWQDEEGNRHAVVSPATIELRSKVGLVQVSADGRREAMIPPARRAYELSQANDRVAGVLRLLGTNAKLDWHLLFKMLEFIEEDAGEGIHHARWAGEKERDRFKASANHPALSGDEARHAVMPGEPGKKQYMSLPDARSWLIDAARQWLESIYATNSRPDGLV